MSKESILKKLKKKKGNLLNSVYDLTYKFLKKYFINDANYNNKNNNHNICIIIIKKYIEFRLNKNKNKHNTLKLI
jgi:hypothetical protein